jgi:arylsulfatase A-like enzyme
MDLDETTIADTFKAAGYSTAAFGKWHNGMQYPYHPLGRGFDEYYGFCSGHWGDYFSPPLDHNGRIVRGDGFVIDDFTNRAIEFMHANKERPFFVYLPYNTPHSPMQVPDRWWDRFKDKNLKMRHRESEREKIQHTRAALAMCENIDWNVGRVLKALDEMELARKTIVLYFCDNGPNGYRWNGGMKGRKGSTDEGGVRSVLFVRWPEKIQAGLVVPQISAAIDLLPTLASMAGIPKISDKTLDGVDLSPLLTGQNVDWPDRLIFSHWRNRTSVRSQKYRLGTQGKLFDLIEDPGQRQDIASQYPQVAQRLQAAMTEWKNEVLPGYDDDQRRFPLGHPDFRLTQIPARDGAAHGGIQRSNRFPNCSYFTNWTSVDDAITWPVDVGADGEYEVELHYTCSEEDVGATIELSCGDSCLQTQINEAHDSPLLGGEHDRVERGESYVKRFKPMKLGTIQLKKGPAELKLRAIDIPGSQVMDFRLMMFKRM